MARKLTSRVLQQRYGVVDRTIDRWVNAGILPKPMRINRIRYWDEADIEKLERDRMASQARVPTQPRNLISLPDAPATSCST
jgi:DNA-binding transcriptional MerR regulator